MLGESMTVCYDCQQSTSGRCWRHRDTVFVNQMPPQAVPDEAQISGIPISKFGTHDALTAKLAEVEAERDRLREAIEKVDPFIEELLELRDRQRDALCEAVELAHRTGNPNVARKWVAVLASDAKQARP